MAEPEVLQEKAPKLHTAQQRIAEKKTAPADLDRGAIDEAKEEVDKKFGALAKDVREASIKKMREDREIMKANMPKKEAGEKIYLQADANFQAVDSLVNQMVSIDNDQNKTLESAGDLLKSGGNLVSDAVVAVDSGLKKTLTVAGSSSWYAWPVVAGIVGLVYAIKKGAIAGWRNRPHPFRYMGRKIGIGRQATPEGMTDAQLDEHIAYMQGQRSARKKPA